MKYLLPFILLWAGNLSAQALVVRTTDVGISNELCDSIVLELELDCIITIVGNTMTLAQGNAPIEIMKVWYTDSAYGVDGVWYVYEHDTGYVYINTGIPYITIEDENGCVEYFNRQ